MLETILLATVAWTVQDHDQPFATYWQDVKFWEILERHPRTLVVDPYCGPDDRPWTKDEIRTLREHGVKPVAYLSLATVGKHQTDLYSLAEEKGLLGPRDPYWEGDRAVRFWERTWLDALRTKFEELRDLGYEGVFIDVVDPWTLDWYVKWFRRETGENLEKLRELTYDALEELIQAALHLGLEVYVNVGGAIFDPKLAELKERYGFKVVVEDVITDDEGNLVPDDVFRDYLRALAHLGSGVYVIEYDLTMTPEVNERLEELFAETKVEAVYVTSLDHDRLGIDIVPIKAPVNPSDTSGSSGEEKASYTRENEEDLERIPVEELVEEGPKKLPVIPIVPPVRRRCLSHG
ncbi:endo alpha-1,4 polygalactosaminidase [Methanopyrus kandleri]|uniref:Predicted extracellular polysaccharide hydrolase of the endo alpha-1,4 polygalactosaminidase family n=1 Tax=Methanopyrus kandleri (strain AV19 / DSM 6324 / JCM 9639 / NBRC 100938) TaxID=190192 RepID=Q8TWD5_METKA|nr:endo alpha-1,4 polygalactosaminidase [Methanopyrus kandleri]AAM02313.1 Predicted extracellular polysaccharide hydrolase of the endo alpha-1,4 polygalactosaminidase family [Methanopyrus kandleri AV19]